MSFFCKSDSQGVSVETLDGLCFSCHLATLLRVELEKFFP